MVNKLRIQMLNVLIFSLYLPTVLAGTITLPNEPGPENNRTLLGIDSNKNEVRDDVEIFIYNTISKEPIKFNAYLKYAETKLAMMENSQNVSRLAELDQQLSKDIICISSIEDDDFIENQKSLRKKIYNTEDRKKKNKLISKKYNSFAKPRITNFKTKRDACRF